MTPMAGRDISQGSQWSQIGIVRTSRMNIPSSANQSQGCSQFFITLSNDLKKSIRNISHSRTLPITTTHIKGKYGMANESVDVPVERQVSACPKQRQEISAKIIRQRRYVALLMTAL